MPASPQQPGPTDLSYTLATAEALSALEVAIVPAEVRAKARLCILDYLACAFASRELPWANQAIALATASSGVPPRQAASIVGTGHAVAVPDAAFANAVLGHGLVRDDMHLGSVSHFGVVVLPVVLALAERHGAPGDRLLAATVAGYEAGGKLGRAILDADVTRVFRPTGITGPFAAAAAGARLLGLGREEFAAALAIAANTASGYNEWAATGGSEMFFQVGFAARSAIAAVELAALGAHASPTALDGRAGMLAAFGKAAGPGIGLPFESRPEILSVFFKEVPACNFAQTAAQAARSVRERAGARSTRLKRVVVRVPAAAAAYPGCDSSGPFEHVLQAKMSIHYNVAAALCTGNFDEDNYLPDANPEIARVAKLVELVVDKDLSAAYPERQGAEVTVTTMAGASFTHRADDVAPASDALVRARFLEAAERTLGAAGAGRLADFVDGIESAADAGELAKLATTRDPRRRIAGQAK